MDQLNGLPIASQVSLDSEEEIVAARAAYDALMDKYEVREAARTNPDLTDADDSAHDNPISKAGYEKLTAAEAALKKAKDDDAKKKDGNYDKAEKAFKDAKTEGAKTAGEVKITAENVEAAKELIKAYEAMNDYQRELFDAAYEESYTRLYKELKGAVSAYEKYIK